jgi:hypothetical protein
LSPSELRNAPAAGSGVKTQRLASFFFFQHAKKAKTGVFVLFLLCFRRLMAVNRADRALKAARVPCALFAALEAKRHHPQLALRCMLHLRHLVPGGCAAFRACRQLRLLLLPLALSLRAV